MYIYIIIFERKGITCMRKFSLHHYTLLANSCTYTCGEYNYDLLQS